MLSIMQNRFCEEYVANGGTGTKAAEAAGYAASGSAATASRVLKMQEVAARMEELREEIRTDASITIFALVQELKGIAFSNIMDYLLVGGAGVSPKDIDNLPRHKQQAISELSAIPTEFGSSIKLRLHSKLAAIERLLKMIGADGPAGGSGAPAGNTLEESIFVIKRRARAG